MNNGILSSSFINFTVDGCLSIIFALSAAICVVCTVILIVFLFKKSILRKVYNVLPFLSFSVCFAAGFLISAFFSLIMYSAFAIIFTIAYCRMRKGKNSLLKRTETSGKINVSFDGGSYDYQVKTMSEAQKEEWYTQYCNNHRIINPIAFIIPTSITYIVSLCCVIFSTDYQGFFAVFI